ncbi:MAG: ribosome maturation factor RimP [Saprospiraceae bacterium]|nr:ribosome maturation factor RimP [Saprospiraceae bacterium]
MMEKLKKAVNEKLLEEDWQDCFFIDINESGNKVQIFIDSDHGITFDRCKKMSRYLESILDADNYRNGRYVLEVSSPGIDRPITSKRQFEKNIGREIKFDMIEGKEVQGKLLGVEGDNLKILTPDPEDKKKKKTIERSIGINDIKKALVQISFKS